MDNNSSRRQLKKLWDVLEVIRNWKSCNQNKEKIWEKITRIETIADGSINPERVGYFLLSDDDKIKFSIKEGDILFSHINSPVHIWKVAISTKNYDDLFHGMNLLLLRGNKKLLDPFFLFNLLNWFFVRWDWELMCKKAINQASLNQKNILEKIIPLPPLEEQKKIVAYLDELNATISKLKSEYQSQLAMLDEMRNSSLDLAFWGSRERERERAYNLNNWKWVKLGEIAKTQSGGTPSRSNPLYRWEGIVRLKSWELEDNNCITKYTETITLLGLENSSAKKFTKGTLLLAMYGATAWKLGILWIDAATNQAVCAIQNTQNKFVEKYIYYFLLKERDKIIRDSFWWAQPNISKTYIDNIELPLPDLETQSQIVSHLDLVHQQITTLKAQVSEQIEHCDQLWQSSLEKVLTQGVE